MDSNKIDYDLFFAVPLFVMAKKKKFILNLNNYRNAHWNLLADAKVAYNELIDNMNLNDGFEPFNNPVKFTYYYYPASARSYDRMNVLSVHDKFACDALIKQKILTDDDYRRVLTPDFLHAGIDKINPRVEVAVKEIK